MEYTRSNLNLLIKDALGNGPETLRHIHGGTKSEAYLFSIGKKEYIIKLLKNSNLLERDVLDLCRKQEIPTPIVHAAKKYEDHIFMIMDKVPGKNITNDDFKALFNAGTMLGKIHAVDASSLPLHRWSCEPKHFSALKGLLDEENKIIFSLYKKFIEMTKNSKEVLCHGHYSPKHIFADCSNITGIIDFGGAMLFPRAYDISLINYKRNELDLPSLLKGYPFPINPLEVELWRFFGKIRNASIKADEIINQEIKSEIQRLKRFI